MRNPEKMKIVKVVLMVIFLLCLAATGWGAPKQAEGKKRILVVDSYHREYNWSKNTNEGFCAAMLKFNYFDNKEQVEEYTANDYVETSRAVIKKTWMDAKRKSGNAEKEDVSIGIYKIARDFNPEFIFLGDDDAVEYVGKKFLDTRIPVVFWGVDNTPVKYGLVENITVPGHNVTGVYQSGYYEDSLRLLKTIVPGLKTFAVLSDESSTGRAKLKAIEYLAQKGKLPLRHVETIATNDYELWKRRALASQEKVDAFFVAMYSSLKDKDGNYVPNDEVARWYLTHIRIPETVVAHHFTKQGMLCTANDSGYNQGFEAVVIAHDILAKGANPATYPPRAPKRGALTVNRQRAAMLGITLTPEMGIEEYIEEADALRTRK